MFGHGIFLYYRSPKLFAAVKFSSETSVTLEIDQVSITSFTVHNFFVELPTTTKRFLHSETHIPDEIKIYVTHIEYQWILSAYSASLETIVIDESS